MKRIGVVANVTKKRAGDVLGRIRAAAKRLSLDVLVDAATAELAEGALAKKSDKLFDEVDLILALGGDGTILRVIRELEGRDRPVLGINVGGLGFLTSVGEADMDRALECVAHDTFQVSTRSILQAELERGGKRIGIYRALNDVVLSNGSASRVVTLDVSVNNDIGTSYVCDGLIVCTPSGSTGHSLSAGGPIITPETPAIVVTLICPHALSSRPMVLPDASQVAISVANSAGTVLMTVDGQVGATLERNDIIRISRSPWRAKLVHLPGYSYFSVLRQKLHWMGSSVRSISS
jgi:NAD+ kinase